MVKRFNLELIQAISPIVITKGLNRISSFYKANQSLREHLIKDNDENHGIPQQESGF
ncbi:MAG: hypothetical protein MTP17_00365 [Candidatus Midichloria sp.]|nr:MAG: hypothetical protein MTP17_00365 [Candidatus Midichloria sp.]